MLRLRGCRFGSDEEGIAEARGPVDGGRRRRADPHFERFGWSGRDARAFDAIGSFRRHLFSGAQPAHDVEGGFEASDALLDRRAHRRKLLVAAAERALHDEAPSRDRRQRPDLLGDEHRVPERQEEQRAGGALVPLGQQPAQHG